MYYNFFIKVLPMLSISSLILCADSFGALGLIDSITLWKDGFEVALKG